MPKPPRPMDDIVGAYHASEHATSDLTRSPVNPYAPHAPTQTTGNSDFNSTKGVTGGTGKHSDPYLIAGWSIAPAIGQAAITMDSTTAYLVIAHVQLLNAELGIYLTNVVNDDRFEPRQAHRPVQ